MLIIGSTALKHYFSDFPREPKDLDYAVTKERKNKEGIEYLYNPIITKYQYEGYLKPELLLSLKISHLFFNLNWEKHLYDVQFLLNKGVKYDIKIVDELFKFWEEYLPKVRRSQLEMNKESFFTNAVNEDTEQHDYLHTLINPIPMYTLLLKDGAEVELDETKWDKLTFEQKCDVVFEETAVMAYERYSKLHYRKAYTIQLKDNIIKHFPRYIALFAIENYPKLEKPKFNYIEQIKSKL
jgi:hypothetical protein